MASSEGDRDLMRNVEKLVHTEKEKTALVVFGFVIIFSVIEIVLAAAMIKISETTTKATKLSPNFTAYYQVLFLQYLPHIVSFEFPGVTH